jgi:hypothetical protein
MEGGLRELEETDCWLELPVEAGSVESTRLQELFKEAGDLTGIFVSSAETAKKTI